MQNFVKRRAGSFRFAFAGLKNGFLREAPLKVHAIGLLFVLLAGAYFHISRMEWAILIICCGLVIASELLNTAVEKICDLINEQYCSRIKYIKDLAAAAVLVLTIASCAIALIIFSRFF